MMCVERISASATSSFLCSVADEETVRERNVARLVERMWRHSDEPGAPEDTGGEHEALVEQAQQKPCHALVGEAGG